MQKCHDLFMQKVKLHDLNWFPLALKHITLKRNIVVDEPNKKMQSFLVIFSEGCLTFKLYYYSRCFGTSALPAES